jgi:hypothetical protein
MVNKHKNKRTFYKELEDQRRALLNNNEQSGKLLDLFGLPLEGRMDPRFGPILMELSVFEDGEWKTQITFPTIENLSQHLGFIAQRRTDEIQTLDISDMDRDELLEYNRKRAKDDLNKYLAKIRPFLLKRGVYLYTIPLNLAERSVETGKYKKSKQSNWILCALPTSRQLAEEHGYSQENIKSLAPLQAWLIPQLVSYNQVKNADSLIAALDGWGALLMPQQKEQMYTSVKKYDRPVMNKKVTQLLLL